jgi:hypothetical protein
MCLLTFAAEPSDVAESDLHVTAWSGGRRPDLCPWKKSNDLARASA